MPVRKQGGGRGWFLSWLFGSEEDKKAAKEKEFCKQGQVQNLTEVPVKIECPTYAVFYCTLRGAMSKIEFEQNWRYGYVLYYGFGSK